MSSSDGDGSAYGGPEVRLCKMGVSQAMHRHCLDVRCTRGRWKFILRDFVFGELVDDSSFNGELPRGYKEKPSGPVYSTTP